MTKRGAHAVLASMCSRDRDIPKALRDAAATRLRAVLAEFPRSLNDQHLFLALAFQSLQSSQAHSTGQGVCPHLSWVLVTIESELGVL